MQQRQTPEEAQRLRQRQGVITDLQKTLGKFEQDLHACIINSLDSSIHTHLNYMKKEDAYVALFSILYTSKKETIANLIKEIMPESAKQIVSTITRQTEQDTFQRSIADYVQPRRKSIKKAPTTTVWTQRRRKSVEEHPDSIFNLPRISLAEIDSTLPPVTSTSKSKTRSSTTPSTKPPFTTSTKSRLPPVRP